MKVNRSVNTLSEVALATKRLECVIATATATEARAAQLLRLAKAPPEILAVARGIYERAGRRLRELQGSLEAMVGMEES